MSLGGSTHQDQDCARRSWRYEMNPESRALNDVLQEYNNARKKFKPFVNAHEAHAVIREEFDEMWDEVKANNIENSRKECIQLAAMCLAYLLEIKPECLNTE